MAFEAGAWSDAWCASAWRGNLLASPARSVTAKRESWDRDGISKEGVSRAIIMSEKIVAVTSPASEFTELFRLGRVGDARALNLAYSLIFARLRRVAARMLDCEPFGNSQTLQPTALVNEMFLRLHRLECHVADREHFVSLAARSMRQYLVDRSRRRATQTRHAPELAASFSGLSQPLTDEQLAARQVWQRLREIDRPAADVVWALKVDGLTINETAARLDLPAWRVVALSENALKWMARKLR